MLSIGLDFVPGLSNFKGGLEFISGYDFIAGQKLDPIQRGISGIGALPFGQIGKAGNAIEKTIKTVGLAYNCDEKVK